MLFIDVTGVLPMCGAGTKTAATVLVETGMVPVVEPVTTVRLDAPIGLITAEVGIPFERDRADDFIAAGREIMAAVKEQLLPVHPETGYSGCEHVVFLAPESEESAAESRDESSTGVKGTSDPRHVLIHHPGWLDRSPDGTGTSALMAVRHARGQLALDTDIVNECFIGTSFTGRLLEETTVGEHVAVVPTITGSAWLTATSQFMLDPSDPFPAGFTL